MKALRPLTASLMLLTSCLLISNTTLTETTLKLSRNQDRSHAIHKALSYLADKTKEYSNSELVIRIYPSAILGNEHESPELVNSGALRMVKINAASLESFAPDHSLFSLSFLFHDRGHYYRVLQNDLGKKILNPSERRGLVGITYYDGGARSFYSNKPITKPEDLARVKIRVQQNPSAIAMIKALGDVATPMAQDEPHTVLQQGMVDGGGNNTIVYADMRHAEAVKVYSRNEHTMVPDVLTVSTDVLNKLDGRERTALLRVASESMTQMKDVIRSATKEEAYDEMKGMNATVVDVDKSVLKERIKPLYDELKVKDAQLAENLGLVKNM